MSGIPLQSSCDPELPEEHVLWALVALPGPGSTAPLLLPVDSMREWSKQLYQCGFRHHPELQEIKYVPPPAATDWVQGAGGRWADMSEALPPEVTAPDISHLSPAEKTVLRDRLLAELPPEPVEDTNVAEVIDES